MSNKVNIYFATYDTSNFIIPFVSFLWEKYYKSGEMIFMGYKDPEHKNLGERTKFVSLAPKRESIKYWSKYICDYFKTINDEFLVFTVDDMSIVGISDEDLLQKAVNYMKQHSDISHCYCAPQSNTIYQHSDARNDKILFNNSDYFIYEATKERGHYVNLQLNLWRRKHLIELLDNEKWNTYDLEITGSRKLLKMNYRCIGIQRTNETNRWHKGVFASTCGHLVSNRYHAGKYNLFGTKAEDIEEGKEYMPEYVKNNIMFNDIINVHWKPEEKGQPK